MNDELFSDLILSRKTRDFDVFGSPFTIFFVRCYICPLIHNILCPLSSPVEIMDLIFLPVDSQYSSPVEALNLIVEPKPLPVEVNNSTIALSYICLSSDERKACNR